MRKSSKKSFGKNRPRGTNLARVARDQDPRVLPQVEDQLSVGKILRFQTTGNSSSTSVSVSYQNLLDAWFIAGTATTGYQLFDLVKIKRVTVRAIPFATSAANAAFQQSVSVGVEFPGLNAGRAGSGNQASNTALGIDNVAMVSLRPSKMSQSAQWQQSSADNAFVVRCTNNDNTLSLGAVIDVELSYKNSADVSPAAVQSAIAGATAGNIYYGGIDGGRLAATWARSAFVPRL